MIRSTFLDILGTDIPIEKTYTFGNNVYNFKFKKNDIGNFFTVEIWDQANTQCLYSNKINYGQNIIDSILAPFEDKIIPLNISKLLGDSSFEEITEESLGTQIKLYTNLEEI